MSLRIRKSIKLGKGVRLNLNKGSVGMSVGGKLGRVSVNSKGRTTTTVHTPIKGVSYVSTSSIKSNSPTSSNGSSTYVEPPKIKMKSNGIMTLLTIFLGWTGIQRFMSGQTGLGILYLCTFGLFGIGWIHDAIWQLWNLI